MHFLSNAVSTILTARVCVDTIVFINGHHCTVFWPEFTINGNCSFDNQTSLHSLSFHLSILLWLHTSPRYQVFEYIIHFIIIHKKYETYLKFLLILFLQIIDVFLLWGYLQGLNNSRSWRKNGSPVFFDILISYY